jgi:predicted PurR-regulated permease PerM
MDRPAVTPPQSAASPPADPPAALLPAAMMSDQQYLLTPRNRRLLTLLLVLGSIALFFVVLGQLASMWTVFGDLVLTFFFAWLLGFVLEPIAAWMARFMPRVVAVTIAYGSVAIAAFGLVLLAASALITSTTEFIGNLAMFQRDLVALLQPVIDWLRTLGFDQVDVSAQIDTILRALATQAQDLLGPLQEIAVASVGVVGNLLIVFFLAVFISIDRAAIGSFLMRLVPPAYADEAHLLTESVGRSFGGFIRGMVIIGGTYALVALIPNLLFGLNYAALTTAAAGVLMAIPFFGPFVAWSPPVIVAAVTQPDALIPTLAIMVVGWFVNQNILQPRVLAGAVGLHPVVVLASVLIGMKLFGIPGAIFGLPVAAVISSFFFYFLRRNVRPSDRSVAARAAQRLAVREGRPARVPREPRPGEVEEILAEEVGLQVDAAMGTRRGPNGTPLTGAAPDAPPTGAPAPDVPPSGARPSEARPADRPAPG